MNGRTPDRPAPQGQISIPLTAEVAQRVVREVVDRASDIVIVHSPHGVLVYANEAACALHGIDARRLSEVPPWGWTPAPAEAIEHRCAQIERRHELTFVEGTQSSDGERYFEIRARWVDTEIGPLIVAVSREITERVELECRLRQMAFRDSLTGLANRALLEDRLKLAISNAVRHGDFLGVLYIDIDDFKPVNDTHGHTAGDHVLRVIAERMEQSVRGEDTVARVGGDEFVVVLPRLSHAEDVSVAARKIRDAIALPIDVGETLCTVGASIGHALYDPGADDVHSLLIRADLAMYHARRDGTTIQEAEPLR